jgi:hypothetical protein
MAAVRAKKAMWLCFDPSVQACLFPSSSDFVSGRSVIHPSGLPLVSLASFAIYSSKFCIFASLSIGSGAIHLFVSLALRAFQSSSGFQ